MPFQFQCCLTQNELAYICLAVTMWHSKQQSLYIIFSFQGSYLTYFFGWHNQILYQVQNLSDQIPGIPLNFLWSSDHWTRHFQPYNQASRCQYSYWKSVFLQQLETSWFTVCKHMCSRLVYIIFIFFPVFFIWKCISNFAVFPLNTFTESDCGPWIN